MAEDPPVSTTAGAAVSTVVTIGGMIANTQSSTVAPTTLTPAVGGPMVSTQIQMQALQVALQAAQNANGGLLNTSVASDAGATSSVGGPMVSVLSSTQSQMQALQDALQVDQNAIGGFLNTSVSGPFNLASMFNSLLGSTLPPAGMDMDSVAQVLQIALQAVQIAIAIGGLLQDVRQIPFFSPEMAVLGPFNLASMFQAILGSVLPPADLDSLATMVSRMALEHYTFLESERVRDIVIEVSLFSNPVSNENKDMNKKEAPKFEREVGQPGFTGCHRCGGNH